MRTLRSKLLLVVLGLLSVAAISLNTTTRLNSPYPPPPPPGQVR